tara:strand:- start:172 stop:513 length:342 start_codon:yes stop_codon:yes gene_type:complete
MNDTKEKHAHTPGPWVISKVIKHGARCYRTIRQEGKFKLAEVFAFNECATGTKEGKAEDATNARLIAAAPELLEQCKLFEKVLRACIMAGDSGAELERDKLREVLAKVEGGEG